MCHFCWKLATLAKQHIARKLKNACDAWKMIAGLETIICTGGQRMFEQEHSRRHPKTYCRQQRNEEQ